VLPGSKRHGGSTAFAQGSILALSDPDRSQSTLQKGKASGYETFAGWLESTRAALRANPGRVRFRNVGAGPTAPEDL
jgi:hypothetical protein